MQTAPKLQRSTSKDKWKPVTNKDLGLHNTGYQHYNGSRYSSVTILTALQAAQPSRPTVQPKMTPVQWVSGALCHAVKLLGHNTDQALPPTAKDKNIWSSISTLHTS
jgi:hypothetical protein